MLPEAGDIAWVEFDPVLGTEQGGRRPALVLSSRIYHEASRRAVVCPITSRYRVWPFNVPLPSGYKTTGSVLVDQIRTIERSQRMFEIIERMPDTLLDEVRTRLGSLLGFPIFIGTREPE